MLIATGVVVPAVASAAPAGVADLALLADGVQEEFQPEGEPVGLGGGTASVPAAQRAYRVGSVGDRADLGVLLLCPHGQQGRDQTG